MRGLDNFKAATKETEDDSGIILTEGATNLVDWRDINSNSAARS